MSRERSAGESGLLGEVNEPGIAPPVQCDQHAQHFAAHRVDACHLVVYIPGLDQ